jgi:hypothetical protein
LKRMRRRSSCISIYSLGYGRRTTMPVRRR